MGVDIGYAICVGSVMTVPEVIDKIGVSALAQALGHKNASTVSSWKARKSIPVEHWPRVVDAAKKADIGGLTYDALVALHSGRRAA